MVGNRLAQIILPVLVLTLTIDQPHASVAENNAQAQPDPVIASGSDSIRRWVSLRHGNIQIHGLTGESAQSAPLSAVRAALDALSSSLRKDAEFAVHTTQVNKQGLVSIWFKQQHNNALVSPINRIEIDATGTLRRADVQILEPSKLHAVLISRTNADAVAMQYVQSLYYDIFQPDTRLSTVTLVYEKDLVPYWVYRDAFVGSSDQLSSIRPMSIRVNAITSEVKEFSDRLPPYAGSK